MLKKIILLCMVSSFLEACTTTINPYTGGTQISKTTGGAAIGAGIGALSSLFFVGKNKVRSAALIGGGVGGLVGSAVGYYMDQQEMDLRMQLQGSGVSVRRDGDHIILNMPNNITFNTNQDAIKSQFYSQLDSVVRVLSKYSRSVVNIIGYTDSTGNVSYNQSLSEHRAWSVAQYLNSRGIDRRRLSVIGYGSQYPIASNATEQGRALNRRVEIQISPLTTIIKLTYHKTDLLFG